MATPNDKRTVTIGHVVLALVVVLGLLGAAFTASDRFATAASLLDLKTRVDRIEDKLDTLLLRLGSRPSRWEAP